MFSTFEDLSIDFSSKVVYVCINLGINETIRGLEITTDSVASNNASLQGFSTSALLILTFWGYKSLLWVLSCALYDV